jgi:uncharacterized protein (TIGR02246 family)
MKRLVYISVLMIVVLGSALTAAAQRPEKEVPPVREAIEAGNQAFMAAFAAHDAAALAGLYTEEGKLLPPNAPIMEGRAAIQAFWQAVMGMGIATAQLDILEVDALGNTAVEVSYFTLFLADGTVADQGKYIVEWKRVSGDWFLHRDIFNSGR